VRVQHRRPEALDESRGLRDVLAQRGVRAQREAQGEQSMVRDAVDRDLRGRVEVASLTGKPSRVATCTSRPAARWARAMPCVRTV